MIEFSLKMAK